MTQRLRPALTLLLALVLASCGWQLRGPVNFDNLSELTLAGASNDMHFPLTNALRDSGILVTDDADITLRIIQTRWDKRTVAVDSLGRIAAVELGYTLKWQLERDKKPLIFPRTLLLTSNVNQDPVNATAASDELELMKDAMRQDAIWQLMRQLQSVSINEDLSAPVTDHNASQPATRHATEH